jgi:hypothetical protein
MSTDEAIVYMVSIFVTFSTLYKCWYSPVFLHWPFERGMWGKGVLIALPLAALTLFIYTLATLASFDVTDNVVYIMFYIFLGYAWQYAGIQVMVALFDLSMIDDVLGANNSAALAAFAGGYLGLAVIYSAANIGDGPGWWCVVFAGGLGLAAWAGLALIVNRFAHVFERITVERDISCGVRTGCYLLASGIILGRASAGDWTSAAMTVIEFLDGWPVLPLTICTIASEGIFIRSAKEHNTIGGSIAGAVVFGILLIFFAVVCVVLLPALPWNPLYG